DWVSHSASRVARPPAFTNFGLMTGFAVARWTGPAIDQIGPATDWVGPATGWSVLTSAERTPRGTSSPATARGRWRRRKAHLAPPGPRAGASASSSSLYRGVSDQSWCKPPLNRHSPGGPLPGRVR